ncbi:transposase [Verminephrobacter aporrectodeae]
MEAIDKHLSGKAAKHCPETIQADGTQEQTERVQTSVNDQGTDTPSAQAAPIQAQGSKQADEAQEQTEQHVQASANVQGTDTPSAEPAPIQAQQPRQADGAQEQTERVQASVNDQGADAPSAEPAPIQAQQPRQADGAQGQTERVQASVNDQGADAPSAEPASGQAKKAKKPKETRVSTTDCDARVMKMADGGFRPAFNAQLAVDTQTMIITGVDITNSGSDMNQMLPMHEQHEQRYARVPAQWLTDGGFAKHEQIEQLTARASCVFAPVPAPKDQQRDRYVALRGDSEAVAQWRERMGTPEAKQIYKERAASIECTNAHLRNRGLQRLNVCGLTKARAVLLWHALAHNLKRMLALDFPLAV